MKSRKLAKRNMKSSDEILASFRQSKAKESLWRAIMVVTPQTVKDLSATVTRLHQIGIEDVHVFATAATSTPKHPPYSVAKDKNAKTPFDAFKLAVETSINTYGSSTMYFLFCEPGVYFYSRLPLYCEQTIDTDRIAVWCPAAPYTLFPDKPGSSPPCDEEQFGWCPTVIDSTVEYRECMIMSPYVLAMTKTLLDTIEIPGDLGTTLSAAYAKFAVPYMFHRQSLVTRGGNTTNFVGVTYEGVKQVEMRNNNFMLKPVSRRRRR